MKVVSNLSSLRHPLPDALGVKPAAVAADGFDFGVLLSQSAVSLAERISCSLRG
jgi:hypothetical protein